MLALVFRKCKFIKTEIAAELFFPKIELVQKVDDRHRNTEVIGTILVLLFSTQIFAKIESVQKVQSRNIQAEVI